MIERPSVDALMAGPLGEWLRSQVVVREEAKAKSNRRFLIAGVILLPVLAVFWVASMFGDWSGELKMFLSFAGLAGGGGWAYAPRAKAIKDTKRGINTAIATALGLTYTDEFEPGPVPLIASRSRTSVARETCNLSTPHRACAPGRVPR